MTGDDGILAIIAEVGGDPADLPFWRACAESRFLLHRCGICRRFYWPASRCIEHGNEDMSWVESGGIGRLYTYTVQHHAYTAEMRSKVPYAVGVVKLGEGPFFHSRIVDCPLENLEVGMLLSVRFMSDAASLKLPLFGPV